MSKPTGPIINGTSTDVSTAGVMAVIFAVVAGLGLYALGLSAGVALVVGLAVFVVGVVVATVKTV